MIAPSPSYDPNNEAQFRSQLEQDQLKTVRSDRAVPSILMLGDETPPKVYRVSIVAGALTAVALP